MSYATQDDLINWSSQEELILYTDMADPPAGAIDAARVTSALEDTDAEINSYLAAQIDTPVTPVPRQLKNLACAIARYRLAKDHASDRVTADFQSAIAWLKSFAQGVVKLGDNTTAAAANTAGTPKMTAADRVFTRDSMKDF